MLKYFCFFRYEYTLCTCSCSVRKKQVLFSMGIYCRPRLVRGMTYPTLYFDTGTLDGFKGAVNLCCYPEFVFPFSVVQVLLGLCKQFITNFVFPTWACAAGFDDNNNNKP